MAWKRFDVLNNWKLILFHIQVNRMLRSTPLFILSSSNRFRLKPLAYLTEIASLHKPNGRVQTVFGLDVLPQWRHRGVAGALMDAFVEAAKQAGREKVTLTCKKRLIGMYEHFGFRLIGQARSEHGGAQWFDMDLDLR